MTNARVFVDGERINGIASVEVEQELRVPWGLELRVVPHVSEGSLVQVKGRIYLGPLTYFAVTHSGLYPLESRHTRGAIEARRDARRHGSG